MAVPKKNKINPFGSAIGKERQQELIDMIADKSVYLPKTIKLIDLDTSVFEYFKNDMEIVVEEKAIPVFYLTKERWADLTLTWQQNDEDGNVVMPFITVRRSEPPKQGTNENIKYRIPQNKKFVYTKVPTFENGVLGVDVYKTPQPTPIDMTYQISIFTHFMEDLNDFNEKIQYLFASGQAYVIIKGYYMPLMLDNVTDESTMNNFEGQTFYNQTFTIKLQGFIQDGDNFEVVNGLRRGVINIRER